MEFSIGSAIRFGWDTFKKRPWFFVGASVVIALAYLVVGSITAGIDASLTGSLDETTAPGAVVSWILTTLVSMGVAAFYLKAHDNPNEGLALFAVASASVLELLRREPSSRAGNRPRPPLTHRARDHICAHVHVRDHYRH